MSIIIESEFQGVTIIIDTHRLSPVHSFDRVMAMLEAGKLVESGEPEALLDDNSSKLAAALSGSSEEQITEYLNIEIYLTPSYIFNKMI